MRITRKQIQGLFQLFLSLAILSFILWRVGPREVFASLSDINWRWYSLALALFAINIVVRAYRWYIFVRTLDANTSFLHLTYLYFVGFFANNFIPSGFGGDVVKVVSLRNSTKQGAEAVSSVLMDRFTGLLGSSLIALFDLIINQVLTESTVDLPVILWVIIVLTSISIPAGFLLVRWTNPFIWAANRWPRVEQLPNFDKLVRLAGTVKRYSWRVLGQSLLITLPFTITLIIVQYSIARALGVDLPISIFALFVPIIAVLNALPISFNGLGVREGIYQFLFVPIGVPQATAVAMALAFTVMRFIAGLIGGLLYAGRALQRLLNSPAAKKM